MSHQSHMQRMPQYPASRPPRSRTSFDARTQRPFFQPQARATAMMSTSSLEQSLDEGLRLARNGCTAG
jgi:hypothetical protein